MKLPIFILATTLGARLAASSLPIEPLDIQCTTDTDCLEQCYAKGGLPYECGDGGPAPAPRACTDAESDDIAERVKFGVCESLSEANFAPDIGTCLDWTGDKIFKIALDKGFGDEVAYLLNQGFEFNQCVGR